MEVVMSEKTPLSKERMGEIALLIVMQRLAKDLPSRETLRRDVPNAAQILGINREEAQKFAEQILPEALKIRFECESVSIDWSDK